jgi:hypothetical protein
MALVAVPLLLGMAALTVDVGYIYNNRADMQRTADAAALAGASGLSVGDSIARSRAIEYAGKNYLGQEAVQLTEQDVEVGNWESGSRSFTPSTDPAIRPNAVRVVGHREGLPLFFAAIVGVNETQVVREAVALADGGRCRGIWGLEGVFAEGGIITDSYKSDEGLYGPGNINQSGDICSNQDIDLRGTVSIRGDAMYGRGYDLLTSGTSYEIWGNRGDICCPAVPPVVDMDQGRSFNDNDTIPLTDDGHDPLSGGGLLLTSDDNLTLNPGTYYFESVRMAGQSTLTITGPTVIYVENDGLFTGGGVVNATADPSNLLIHSAGGEIDLAGGSGFYGAVIAPESNVRLVGNSEYFGNIIARTIDVRGDAVIHVDETIVDDVMGGEGGVVPVLVR